MVSVERCFNMINVAHEKAMETDYDQKMFKREKDEKEMERTEEEIVVKP